MFYEGVARDGGRRSIGVAVSADGLRWRRRPVPVLEAGPPGAWDSGGVGGPCPVPMAGAHPLSALPYMSLTGGLNSDDVPDSSCSAPSLCSLPVRFPHQRPLDSNPIAVLWAPWKQCVSAGASSSFVTGDC